MEGSMLYSDLWGLQLDELDAHTQSDTKQHDISAQHISLRMTYFTRTFPFVHNQDSIPLLNVKFSILFSLYVTMFILYIFLYRLCVLLLVQLESSSNTYLLQTIHDESTRTLQQYVWFGVYDSNVNLQARQTNKHIHELCLLLSLKWFAVTKW